MKIFGFVICCFALAFLAFVDAIVWDIIFGLGLSYDDKILCWVGAIGCAIVSGILGIFWFDMPETKIEQVFIEIPE